MAAGDLLLLILVIVHLPEGGEGFVGVNIGSREEGSEMPVADKIVDLLLRKEIAHVRLANADGQLLKSLSRTGIEVMVGVGTDELQNISESPTTAASWIRRNIIPFTPSTNITSIAIPCNFFISSTADHLIPAMNHLHNALVAANLDSSIKISTPTSMDSIPNPFPPSEATFNSSLSSTISQLLQFLANTRSPFMLNAYPYNYYTSSNGIFPLDYALARPFLSPSHQIVDPNTLLTYTSMLDSMVDATYHSMEALNFSKIPVVVTETGWPWAWDGGEEEDQPEATVDNSGEYSRNLVGRRREGVDVYIYEMFSNERRRRGYEKLSWGMLYGNGSEVYAGLRSFNGSSSSWRGGEGKRVEFCVAKEGAEEEKLREGIRWACGKGKADCDAIQKGKVCFYPDTPTEHASYAYNDYYQRMRNEGGSCDFDGTAHITSVDPSKGSCIYAASGRVGSTSRRGNRTSDRVQPVKSGAGEWRRRRRRGGVSMLLLLLLGYLIHGGVCLWFFGVT